MHIEGDRNCWGDMLSRWVAVSSVIYRPLRSTLQASLTIRCRRKKLFCDQRAWRVLLGSLAARATSFMTECRQAVLDDEELFRIDMDGRDVLWIPGDPKKL